MKKVTVTRSISLTLGIFLIAYAANQFLHIIPISFGEMPDFTRKYIDSIAAFLPALYIFEILIGLMLVLNKWVAFISLILAPLSVSFLFFNFANGGWHIATAAFVAVLNILLFIQYREKYRPLFD